MRVFSNFFIKTIAFLVAITLFFITLGVSISFFSSDIEKVNSNKFIFAEGDSKSLNKIVLIELRGPILNEPSDMLEFNLIDSMNAIYVSEFINNLEEIKRENPKGIIISMDSPGGTVSATYNLYNAIEEFKKNNQTKIFLHTNELLASGGYWAALASDKIYANYGAMIGSIGVRGPDWIYYDKPISISTGILGQSIETKDGIKTYNTIAGRSKDLFNSFRMPTKEETKILQSIITGVYIDFVNIVSKKRSIESNFITEDLGALIFDAKMAKDNYLIDDIKNLKEVINQVVKDLSLKDYKIIKQKRKKSFFTNLIQTALIMKYDLYSIRENRVCSLINGYINVILINNKYMNSC